MLVDICNFVYIVKIKPVPEKKHQCVEIQLNAQNTLHLLYCKILYSTPSQNSK